MGTPTSLAMPVQTPRPPSSTHPTCPDGDRPGPARPGPSGSPARPGECERLWDQFFPVPICSLCFSASIGFDQLDASGPLFDQFDASFHGFSGPRTAGAAAHRPG